MPPNILTVFRRSDPGEQLIAKKVCESSNELEILKVLNNFQPKSEHIISLLDSFEVQSRTWAILPKMDSVMDYIEIAPGRFSENIGQICWGLIKGLAYLHGHCIAHRDIKPDNLLVRKDFCLKVIDFDLAIKVRDEDEEVDGQCGTEGWMAPEVEARLSMYSPIKADRWSCGQVIMYLLDEFGKKDEPLTGIAMKRRLAMSGEDEPLAQDSQAAWPPRPSVDSGDEDDSQVENELSDLTELSTDSEGPSIPVPQKRKGKSGEVPQPRRQSTRTRKPSAHVRRLATGEGTTDGTSQGFPGWHPEHVGHSAAKSA